MNVQLYVGGTLAYDNALPEEKGYNVFSIAINESVNKGGTAKVVLPRKHPAYDSFSPFCVPVEIYRDGKLRWRGRPIPPTSEDSYGRKTVVCEGELCFLQDAINRPYSYTGTPEVVFSQVIGIYNAAVEPWKRFIVGNVTVAGNAELSSTAPESVLETVQKLVEQHGGYIIFDTAPDGSRRINWYKDSLYTCNQTVRYGYNLTDFRCQTEGTGFATRIIPYGAAGEDGTRIKIDVNGVDYVENTAAIAEHGIIEKAVIYNSVTDPAELKARAESEVAVTGLIPAVIQLSAIDLSRQDLTLDAFAVGQQVPAESDPHKLSGNYWLMSLSEDLVNPQVGGITLLRELTSISGGPVRTLTGAIAVSQKGLLSAANNYAEFAAQGAVKNQTQEFIFNKLTQNGALQGLYMLDGQLYVNASYLKSGTLDASLLKTGVITSADGTVKMDLARNEITIEGTDGSRLSMSAGTLTIKDNEGNTRVLLGEFAGPAHVFSLRSGNNTKDITFFIWDDLITLGLKLVGEPNVDAFSSEICWKKVGGIYTIVATPQFSGKKVLFSGSAAAGTSFAIPDTADYDLFGVRLGDDSNTFNHIVLAYKINGVIRGVGGWSGTSTDYKELFFVSATYSDNTWTLLDVTGHSIDASGGFSSATKLSVKEVIGII